jgi:Tfp pilus assembly protein PilZ
MAQRRRDVRYTIQFPVQLVHAKRAHSLVTQDVSGGGVFVCTNSPPPLLQLVQVHLVLPIGGHALKAHGMTVHVVDPENPGGRVAGIGVQFYGLYRATREAWDSFTRHVAAHCPQSADQTPLRLTRGETPEPLSRRFGRHIAVLELKPATLEALEEIYTRDVSTGRLFVPTTKELPPDANVVINVTHPESKAPFLFEAKVRSRSVSPAGFDVELRGVDKNFREEFLDFVRGSIVIDTEVEFVTPTPAKAGPGEGEAK